MGSILVTVGSIMVVLACLSSRSIVTLNISLFKKENQAYTNQWFAKLNSGRLATQAFTLAKWFVDSTKEHVRSRAMSYY